MVAEPIRLPAPSGPGSTPGPEPVPGTRSAPDTLRRPGAVTVLTRAERNRLLDAFHDLLPAPETLEPGLRRVLIDLVEHPGSLARAELAYGVVLDCRRSRLGDPPPSLESGLRLAVAIESFHTASLVFDDMPAMDDATERRGRPCPHLTHGEATATLGALAFITRAYALLWEALGSLPTDRRAAAGALVSACLGAEGILDGQARDLRFGRMGGGETPADRGAEVLRVAAGKTVPLVRLAVVLPAIAGGADGIVLGHLEELSEAWGLAYQVLDDFKDGLMSREETGKSTARDGLLGRPNLPDVIGPGAAMERLDGFLGAAREALHGLRSHGFPIERLGGLQARLEADRVRVAERSGLVGPTQGPTEAHAE